jgi:hypothetical protein
MRRLGPAVLLSNTCGGLTATPPLRNQGEHDMRNRTSQRASIALIALLAATCSTTDPYTGGAVQAETPLDGRSCLMVFHGCPNFEEPDPDYTLSPVAAAGMNGTSYNVEYRLYSLALGSWGSWQSPTESPAETSAYGGFLFYYESALHDVYAYDQVEWRVTMDAHAGTRIDNGGAVISVEGEQAYVTEPLYAAVGDAKDCWTTNLGATIVYEDQ